MLYLYCIDFVSAEEIQNSTTIVATLKLHLFNTYFHFIHKQHQMQNVAIVSISFVNHKTF